MSEKQNILDELWLIIEEKSVGDDESSYTKTMLNKDINHVARKMGEEAIETIVAAIGQTKKDTVNESADLIYLQRLCRLWMSETMHRSLS